MIIYLNNDNQLFYTVALAFEKRQFSIACDPWSVEYTQTFLTGFY